MLLGFFMHNSPAGGNMSVMTPRLRTLIDHASRLAETDAVLLRKFADARDPQAFAELVRRYGRLVWGQCRHLLHSEADADDAFQATFLALANAARTLRDSNKLGSWLHSIAYRICQQLKRTAARRTRREKVGAKAEATRPVPDSAWDQAFAAVHDELAKLPDTLRVPFVLCVLEGKGTTEAAAQLGLKLGTLSSRLSRAKQTLLERLSARGLTAGLAAVGAVAVGASNAPAVVIDKTCDLAAGGAVPANILSLTHGVLNMAGFTTKRWAMAAMLACGLAVGVGGVMTANGQDKPKEQPAQRELDQRLKELDALKQKMAAEEDKVREIEQLHKLKATEATKLAEDQKKLMHRVYENKKQPEFRYHGQLAGYAPTPEEFERTVREIEAEGYTFVAIFEMKGMTKAKDGVVPTLVFRRKPSGGEAERLAVIDLLTRREDALAKGDAAKRAEQEKVLQDQIEQLNRQLAELKAEAAKTERTAGRTKAMFALADVGGDSAAATALLTSLVRTKFGADVAKKVQFEVQGESVLVEGPSKEQLQWLLKAVKGLGESAPNGPAK